MITLVRTLFSASMIFICLNSQGQSGVGHVSMMLKDPDRGSRKVTFEAYFPISASGTITQMRVSEPPFPVICFAHGYRHPGDKYENLIDFLVPAGYIMLCITTSEGLFPSYSKYADDLSFLAGKVTEMGMDVSSPLYGLTDSSCCLMGHSMGGGAIFSAARHIPEVNALIALAPYEKDNSVIDAARGLQVPTLIFSGTNDCITPPDKYHLPLYKASASEDKTLIMIKGGTHCSMGNSKLCIKAEWISGCSQGLNTEEQTAVLARYLLPWLSYVLKNNKLEGQNFAETLASDEAVAWLRSQALKTSGE